MLVSNLAEELVMNMALALVMVDKKVDMEVEHAIMAVMTTTPMEGRFLEIF